MVSVPNPAGGSMDVSSTADAISKGWTPAMGTFGTSPDGSSGSSKTPAATTAAPATTDLSGYVAAMAASSGLSIKQLDEQKREFDATLAQKQLDWQQQGLPTLVIAQRTADLEDAKFKELQSQAVFTQNLQTAQQALSDRIQTGQLTNATAAQELANRIQSGQLAVQQDQQALARQIQTGQLAVSQGQLGLDTLKTAASLSGPADWLKSQAFSRGVANTSNVPTFVGDLLSGRSTATLPGAAAGAVVPAANTLQTMASNMGVPATAQQAPAAPVAAATPATVDPNASPADRAAAYTSGATAAPTAGAAPSGFFTQIAGNNQVYTPSAAETTAAGPTAASSTAGLDPAHLAAFYSAAVRNANDGTQTPGALPDASPWATTDMVSAAFGKPATSAATATGTDDATAAMRKLYAQGGNALAPQAIEGLTASEKSMLTGGIDTAGGDSSTYVDQYARSRIGQSAAKPSVTAMAGGGVVTQPTYALIGEAGPEAVVPLGGPPAPTYISGSGTPWDGASGAQPPPPGWTGLPQPSPAQTIISGSGTPWDGASGAQPPPNGPYQTQYPPVPNPQWDGISQGQPPLPRNGPVDPFATLSPVEQRVARYLASLGH